MFLHLLLPLLQAPAKPAPVEVGPGRVDAMVQREWKGRKITPAPLADDATFLRRVYQDLAGTLPPTDIAWAFLHDSSPNRRQRLVDQLLNSRRYAEHWTVYWDRVLMGRESRDQTVDRGAFRAWLYGQFEKNAPWNQVVTDLLTAEGQNSPGDTPRPQALGIEPMDKARVEALKGKNPDVNGAVNYFLRFAQMPQDLAGSVSKSFLGLQIQCAQCHDHKTEKWTQGDFRAFTSCFAQVRMEQLEKGPIAGTVRRMALTDVPKVAFPGANQEELKPLLNARPAALDGSDLSAAPERRRALAKWITAPENPWFAAALVNRMWDHLMGRPLLAPVNDLPSDPAEMPELLRLLAQDFSGHGYNLKRLLRTLCLSQTYQRAAGGTPEALAAFAAHPIRPMGPDDLVDALIGATQIEGLLQQHASERLDAIKAQIVRQFIFLFAVDEDHEQRSFEGTVPQALMLLNGRLTNDGGSLIPGDGLSLLLRQPGDDAAKVQSLYLRTLSRLPSPSESARWLAFVKGRVRASALAADAKPAKDFDGLGVLARLGTQQGSGDPREQAFEDLFWALLNATEFVTRH